MFVLTDYLGCISSFVSPHCSCVLFPLLDGTDTRCFFRLLLPASMENEAVKIVPERQGSGQASLWRGEAAWGSSDGRLLAQGRYPREWQEIGSDCLGELVEISLVGPQLALRSSVPVRGHVVMTLCCAPWTGCSTLSLVVVYCLLHF